MTFPMTPPMLHWCRRLLSSLAVALLLAGVSGLARAAPDTVPALTPAIAALAQLQGTERATAIAAHISQEGHWTLVNSNGEIFTAASADELKRAWGILLPDLAAATSKPTVFLTPDSVFDRRARLVDLPTGSTLWLAGAANRFRLIPQGTGTTAKLLAEIRPSLLLELTTADAFAQTLPLLARPLDRSAFRLLSIEPGGPRSISAAVRRDAATGQQAVDAIDPNFLSAGLGALRGQTALIVGRLDNDTLFVKPTSGPERTLRWSELITAATAADVSIAVVKSAVGQQPGGRNWLWQKVEVKGLDRALTHATLADFLDALGAPGNRLVITPDMLNADRTILDIHRVAGLPSSQSNSAQMSSQIGNKIGGMVSDIVSGLAGKVVHDGALLHLRSATRQTELDRRLIPYVPSLVQWVYGGLLLLGLAGWPVARRWWQRLWPAETRAEYASAIGHWAARIIRISAFVALFLPLAALAAAPTHLLSLMNAAAFRKTLVKSQPSIA